MSSEDSPREANPLEVIAAIDGTPECGKKVKNRRKWCEEDAGHGTDHPGVGYCHWHDDEKSRTEALAIYSVKKKFQDQFPEQLLADKEERPKLYEHMIENPELAARFLRTLTDDDPMDLRREIALLRAQIDKLAEENLEGINDTGIRLHIGTLSQIIRNHNDIETRRMNMIAAQQVRDIMQGMSEIMQKYIHDPRARKGVEMDVMALMKQYGLA